MSYSGRVPCSCVRDGLVSPPADGFAPTFDECGDLVVEPADGETAYGWLRDACPHEFQDAAHEFLANAWGMAEFRTSVRDLGRHHVLIRWLPTSNGGCIPASDVGAALAELEDFRRAAVGLRRCRLVESASGEVL